MKMITKILIGLVLCIVALVALVLITALFVKKEYLVEREITIDKPQSKVFEYLKYLKNQENYSVWVMTDPHMKKIYKGTDGTVGFIYGWNGNNKAGEGEQELKSILENERLDMEIRFERPFKSVGYVHFLTEALSDTQTKVKWGMKGKSSYPMNFMNLFTGSILGSDLDKSLGNLKTILEKE